jgi:hypothetical protein
MQMQEEVRQHHHDPISPIKRCGMAEDALPNLRFANHLAEAGHTNLRQVLGGVL